MRFNELQNTGAIIGRGVGQLLALQEQEGITTSAPELMPVISLDDQEDRLFLQGYALLMGVQAGVTAGGAGFRSQMAIDNPPNSGVICEIERIQIAATASETTTHSISFVQLNSSTGNLVSRDLRNVISAGGSAPSPIALRIQNTIALSGEASVTGRFSVAAATTTELIMKIVLGPGTSWRIRAEADNVAIVNFYTFFIKSRALNPRERP